MSAAHELIERGFDVSVYERNPIPGGKARSTEVKDSATGGRRLLPGEHGFRFFPGFYRHIIDTMNRIPYQGNKKVTDNLVVASQLGLARFDQPPVILSAQLPWGLSGLRKTLETLFESNINMTRDEVMLIADRIWELMTSCIERRSTEQERLSWLEFTDANNSKSDDYKKIFVRGITRTLVAARAETASTFTIGSVFLQTFFDMLDPSIQADRVLNGPTNDVWINPWLKYLTGAGVDYHLNATVEGINISDRKISSVSIRENDTTVDVHGDYYIAALPVEVMAKLITPDMVKCHKVLEDIVSLGDQTEWMVGLQIYLNRDVKISHGHLNYVDSPWALTSISQQQFWTSDYDLNEYGDGKVRGIISVDISDWTSRNGECRSAKESTREQIFEEVWEELKKCFIEDDEHILKDEDFHSFNLDEDIKFENGPNDPDPDQKTNLSPLMVNLVSTRTLRPQAYCPIPNLFLASDYVRTNTDLACMEGANEAARRAVNCIIDASGSRASLCRIWSIHEPGLLAYWRERDRRRFARGLDWNENLSISEIIAPHLWFHIVKFLFRRIWARIRKLTR